MNILFIVPYAPTLIRTRPYNLIRGLVRRGNQVTLASLWESKWEHAALHDLEREGIKVISAPLSKHQSIWNTLWALPSSIPLQAVYCWQPALVQILASEISQEHFDVIHVEHLRGVRYGLWLKSYLSRFDPHPKIVWDSVDCISYLFEQAAGTSASLFGRIVPRIELERTRRYEAWLVKEFDQIFVTSDVDKNALAQLGSTHKVKTTESANVEHIAVMPNGVDLGFFTPPSERHDVDKLVFSGKMSYHANVTAAMHLVNDIMPLIWEKKPEVRVCIVGKDPSDAVRHLATRHPRHVVVTGTVPDIRPYLASATVAVCPIRYGAGIQNKVLEALAMATPVVTTPQGIAALQVHHETELLVAASKETFAQHVLRLLDDENLRCRLGQAGRRYVEQHHDWNAIVAQLESFYR